MEGSVSVRGLPACSCWMKSGITDPREYMTLPYRVSETIVAARSVADVIPRLRPGVLVITSGDRRVDEKKVDALVGKTGRADAEFVKAKTGFSIGGVSPLAHAQAPVTLIDRELLRFEVIWAAAGHPHGVFQLRPQDLQAFTGAPLADVVQVVVS